MTLQSYEIRGTHDGRPFEWTRFAQGIGTAHKHASEDAHREWPGERIFFTVRRCRDPRKEARA